MEAGLVGNYSRVAGTLAHQPDNYGPALEVIEDTEQVFWQAWVSEFARAMRLRPGAWARIGGSDELDVQEAGRSSRTSSNKATSGFCRPRGFPVVFALPGQRRICPLIMLLYRCTA